MNDKHPLRVLIVGPAHSIHVQRWSKTLADTGVDVMLLSERPLPHGETGIMTFLLPGKGLPRVLRYMLGMLYVPVLIFSRKPDAVHVHSLGTNALLALTVPSTLLVVTPWGSDISTLKKASIRARLVGRVMRRASRILTTSHQMNSHVSQSFGISKDNIEVISWGVDTDLFYAARSAEEKLAERRKWGLPEEALIVFSNRSTSATYRTLEMVSAFASAAAIRPELHLLIIGGFVPANEGARLRQDLYIQEVKKIASAIPRQVTFIDHLLSPSEMASLLRASDAAVAIPNADQRSTSVLEAIATGIRVVLSDIEPYRELIAEGVCADLVEEPIETGLAQSFFSLRPIDGQFQEQNKKFIAEYETWKVQANKVIAEYYRMRDRKK